MAADEAFDRDTGYLTVSDVARALGIGTTTLRRRERTIYSRPPGSVGSGSITRRTSNCSVAGTKCRQRQPAAYSLGPSAGGQIVVGVARRGRRRVAASVRMPTGIVAAR